MIIADLSRPIPGDRIRDFRHIWAKSTGTGEPEVARRVSLGTNFKHMLGLELSATRSLSHFAFLATDKHNLRSPAGVGKNQREEEAL